MLRENNKEKVTVEINVNTNKANQFINDLVNLLNKYGLDGINICNESIIQINLLDVNVNRKMYNFDKTLMYNFD